MKFLKQSALSAFVAAVVAGGQAMAVDLPSRPYLPLAQAQKSAQAALNRCQADGYRVSAAVVDRGGVVLALLRADGAGVHTVDSSRKKAYTAASLGRSTQELAALIVSKPELQALRDMNAEILMLGGGLPVKMGDEVVGGIGVGGAPGAHLDEACAKAGLAAIGAGPKSE